MEGILVDISEDELKILKLQLSRLKLETRLRKDLGSKLDRQKTIAVNAENLAKQRGDEIEEISRKLLRPDYYSDKERLLEADYISEFGSNYNAFKLD